MRVIQKAEMIKAQGAKILRFELLLCELGNDRFVVNYRQGLVDGSTYDGSITLRPLSRLDAERAFQKAIEKQSREGYEQLAEGEPPPLPHAPVRAPAAAPLPTPLPTPLPAQPSATTTPAVPALTPEARKAQARARYEKQVLAGLTAALSRTQREGNTALGRAISRADLLRLKKAEPMLLRVARDVSMPKAAMASAVWALGRCGSHQSISTLGALYAEKKTPEQVRRAAAEALMALSDEGTRNEFRASLRLALPDKLRVFAPDSDPEAFQLALSEHLTPNTDEAHAVIDLLYQISDPVSRPALLSYARTMPLKPPVFRRLRHLFRAAEFRRDAELYGLIAYRLELGKAGFQAPRWGNHYEHDLKSGQRACGSRTRTYLRRRVWRTLRMLGQLGDETFVPMAVGALLPYADSNAQQARTHSSYDYKSRKYTSTEYGPFAAFFTFNKLLFRHSKRFREVPRLLHRERFEKAGKQPREPREEAFPEQWRARPEGLLHLLDESRAGLVHEFAAMTLAECKEFCEGLDLDLLKMLLSKPYEPTAKLGYELVRRRYRPGTSRPRFAGRAGHLRLPNSARRGHSAAQAAHLAARTEHRRARDAAARTAPGYPAPSRRNLERDAPAGGELACAARPGGGGAFAPGPGGWQTRQPGANDPRGAPRRSAGGAIRDGGARSDGASPGGGASVWRGYSVPGQGNTDGRDHPAASGEPSRGRAGSGGAAGGASPGSRAAPATAGDRAAAGSRARRAARHRAPARAKVDRREPRIPRKNLRFAPGCAAEEQARARGLRVD